MVAQQIRRKFNLVLCELHNPVMHGFCENSDPEIRGHYLTIYKKKHDNGANDSDSNGEDDNTMTENPEVLIPMLIRLYNNKYRQLISSEIYHPFIKNYKSIISNPSYIKLEIAQTLYLSGQESVSILKTFWIRLVQRSWKRVFIEKANILKERTKLSSLHHKQVTGCWPLSCRVMPGLHGLLQK